VAQEPDEPGREPPEELPPEPYAYLSAPGRLRDPWALIISFGLLALFGVWVMILASMTQRGTVGLFLAGVIMILLLSVGGFGIHVGIRRLLWKRRYRRVTGRNPW
jgi:hypothetical protein